MTTWRVVAGSSRTARGVGGGREARLTKDPSREQHGGTARPQGVAGSISAGHVRRHASRRPPGTDGPSRTAYFKR